jgi:hypothetical protein
MAKRTIPKELGLHLPAYHTVLYEGVPMFRAQAWVLYDYKVHGGHYQVNSGNRQDNVVKQYRGHGLRAGYSSQPELFGRWQDALRRWGHDGAIAHGVFPANRPGTSSHEGLSDGNPFYTRETGRLHASAGQKIAKHQYGLDIVDKPGGDAARFVQWANSKGYSAVRPYPTLSERHHMAFKKSPATRARARLARWVATGR